MGSMGFSVSAIFGDNEWTDEIHRIMNTLEAHLLVADKYIFKKMSLNIGSNPPFLIELMVCILSFLLFVYLTMDIAAYANRIQQERVLILRARADRLRNSETSQNVTSLSYQNRTLRRMDRSKSCRKPIRFPTGVVGDLSEAEKLTSLTPAEFVRLDQEERKVRNQALNCLNSLTTLFTNILHGKKPKEQMRKEIEEAKEDCKCAPIADPYMRYIDSQSVTDSLINVMEEIIEETTAENPLPTSADLSSLIYDIGNFKLPDSPVTSTSGILDENPALIKRAHKRTHS